MGLILAIVFFVIVAGCATSTLNRAPATDTGSETENSKIRNTYVQGLGNARFFPCKVSDGTDTQQAVVALYYPMGHMGYQIATFPLVLKIAGPFYSGIALCGGPKGIMCKTASKKNFSDEIISNFVPDRDGDTFEVKGVKYSCPMSYPK